MIDFIKKNLFILISIFFTFYYLYTFSNALDISGYVVNALLLVIVLYFQTIGELFYFYKKHGRPRLQDYFRLALFATTVLNFMKLVNEANGNPLVSVITQTVSLNDAFLVLSIVLIAFVSLDLAYIFMQTKKRNFDNSSYKITRKNLVFILLIFTTFAKAYLLASGLTGFGVERHDSSGLLSLVNALSNILTPFSLVLSAYIIYIEKVQIKLYKTIFYASFLMQIFLGLLSGMKENTLAPILFVGIVFLFSGSKIPKKIIYIGIFLIMFLYPINNAYRNIVSNPYTHTNSHLVNMSLAIQSVFSKDILETLSSGSESYGKRGEMFPFLEYSVNSESKWNYYKNMSRYITLPLAWIIPRAVWSNKPRADIGAVLYQQVVGIRTKTSITPTAIGWAFLEGGIFYLIIIFALLGIVFEFVDKNNHNKPINMLLYIVLFHYAIKPEWDPYFMLASIMQFYIMYWILLKFIGQTRILKNEN
jgi:hypothetical protein